MTENTTTEGQQSNPGATEGDATGAANPNGQGATAPVDTQGQGDGGNKPADEAGKGDAAKPEDDGSKAEGAPESYADFTLPEGVTLEGERKEAAIALFKELGLPQDKAQRAIDHFVQTIAGDESSRAAAVEQAVSEQREKWGEEAKAKFGDKYTETVNYARTAIKATNNPELLRVLDESGLGNNPAMIEAFAIFGRQMRDSPIDGIGGESGAAQPKTLEQRMYPDKNP